MTALALIAIIPGTLMALVTWWGLYVQHRSIRQIKAGQVDLQQKTVEYHLLINSRMDELLIATRAATATVGHAAGMEEGRAAARAEFGQDSMPQAAGGQQAGGTGT